MAGTAVRPALSQTVLANQVDDLAVFGGDGDDVLDANGLAADTTLSGAEIGSVPLTCG